jgi:hypothetical protein
MAILGASYQIDQSDQSDQIGNMHCMLHKVKVMKNHISSTGVEIQAKRSIYEKSVLLIAHFINIKTI